MIYLYSDVLFRAGGIETYLHALALHLQREDVSFEVVISELERCPLVDELVAKGISVYRQRRVPGDRWLIRQRLMMLWLRMRLGRGDLVFCVRQPMPQLYFRLVRLVHRAHAKIAASWMLAPEFLPPPEPNFNRAVAETDAVISVSRCTVSQFKTVYGYDGPVRVVPYHNIPMFEKVVPLPVGPPWKIGFLGRLEIKQKSLDQLLDAFSRLLAEKADVELHVHGRGPDRLALEKLANKLGIQGKVFFYGAYDHRRDLPQIVANCHLFVHPSRFEGGPCFTLLEIMQAGRFCVATEVGGIPDLYESRPEIGLMTRPNSAEHLSRKLKEAVDRIAQGTIDGGKIRSRYFEGFDVVSAHRAWTTALQM